MSGWLVGVWIFAIIFTIIYFVILNFTVEKIEECNSLMGQLGMIFSGNIAQKCKMVGIMGAFAPLAYYGVVFFWILAILSTVAYVIVAIIRGLSNRPEGKIDSGGLVRYCVTCNHNLSKEELENHHCNNCGITICTCHCHDSYLDSCEYCKDWHR